MKICFVASSGGHLEEIACIHTISDRLEAEAFLITEDCGFEENRFGERQYYLKQINRKERGFLIHFIQIFIETSKIFHKENPDFVISTGALASYPACLIGKLKRKKVIYIESFARIDKPSLTGKLVYVFADLFLVQWEEQLRFYPKAKYVGGVF